MGPGLTRNFIFKSSQYSPILVLIFWVVYHVYFVNMYSLLMVVSHYGSCSVRVSDGFNPKKTKDVDRGVNWWGEIYPVFLGIFF